MKNHRRVLLLELNEFNRDLLDRTSKLYGFQNIQKLLSLPCCEAHTDDTYESDFLEPWVQWVSVHTGRPSSEHRVKHLGDVPSLNYPQLWETLSQQGVSTGVWGVLNGSLGEAQAPAFFFPDPWTFSEHAVPTGLNDLLALPRYMAKNRMSISKLKALFLATKFIKRILFSGGLVECFLRAPLVVKMILRYPGKEFPGFVFAEYLLGMVFLHNWKSRQPQFGILFLNSLAHLQHYYWEEDSLERNEKLKYGLYFLEKLVEKLLNIIDLNQDILIVANALSQQNTEDEDPWISYRPIDHGDFLETIGVSFSGVEPLMSYDALIFFRSESDVSKAKKVLDSAVIDSQKLFLVEQYEDDPLKLFYRFNFFSPLNKTSICSINGENYEFFKLFQVITQRTGKHIPLSHIFSNAENLPTTMKNHELYHFICSLFPFEKELKKVSQI